MWDKSGDAVARVNGTTVHRDIVSRVVYDAMIAAAPKYEGGAALGVQANNLEQHRDALLTALQRLISSDQHIEMFPTSELEICANNESLTPTLREQAASVIQARAVIAMVKGCAA